MSRTTHIVPPHVLSQRVSKRRTARQRPSWHIYGVQLRDEDYATEGARTFSDPRKLASESRSSTSCKVILILDLEGSLRYKKCCVQCSEDLLASADLPGSSEPITNSDWQTKNTILTFG